MTDSTKHDTIVVTDHLRQDAHDEIMMLVKHLGVDLQAQGVQAFVDQMITNRAVSRAWDLFHTKIIHQMTFGDKLE